MSNKPTITARLCESKPAKATKVYDGKCPGFYVSLTPRGVATFYFKYWDRVLCRQVPIRLGVYHPEHLTVDAARAQGRVGRGEDVAQTARRAKAVRAILSGKMVENIIDEYIDWLQQPVRKADGEILPRIESWENTAGYLNRFLRPMHGKRLANEINNDDIARLQDDILHGRVNRKFKASLASARNARDAMSGLFKWAAEAGRRYVDRSPCHDLPSLPAKVSRERVLTDDEIRTLWWGLDRPDLPWPRAVALGLKFELVTMLRTKEFLTATPKELKGLGTPDARIEVPLRRVKERRVIVQPLSSLAQEILGEAITSPDQPFIFHKGDGSPFGRTALAIAVRGYRRVKPENWKLGIFEFLGMEPWTPHDLRRTPASLANELGFNEVDIGYCLDHTTTKGENAPAPVTRVYVREGVFRTSRKMKMKREILDAVAADLRRIIGPAPTALAKAA